MSEELVFRETKKGLEYARSRTIPGIELGEMMQKMYGATGNICVQSGMA